MIVLIVLSRSKAQLPKLKVLNIANLEWWLIFQTKITKKTIVFLLHFLKNMSIFAGTFAKTNEQLLAFCIWGQLLRRFGTTCRGFPYS